MNTPIRRLRVELVTLGLSLQALAAGTARKSPTQMVDAGGYRVRMLVEGQGSPRVVSRR